MKILFVIPKDDDDDKYIFKLKFNEGIYIPLGTAQLASVLKQEGHNVRIIDLRLFENNGLSHLKTIFTEYNPELVGMYISFFSKEQVIEISQFLKQINPDCNIMLGGPYLSYFSRQILEHETIDFVTLGESEHTIIALIKNIADVSKLKKINGLGFKNKQNEIILNDQCSVVKDLDKLPYLSMDLFDVKQYIPLPKHYKRLPLLPMITGRGCAWSRCIFCSQQNEAHAYRRQSPKRVVDEITYHVKKLGIKEIRFWDDNFFTNKKWVFEFCDLLDEANLDIIWGCHARVSDVTSQLLKRVYKSGCWQMMFGIESGSQKLLNILDKGITLKQAKNAVVWAKKAGLDVRSSFILGVPGETPRLANRTIRFAKSLDSDVTQFSIFTPYPGTRFFKTLQKQNNSNTDFDQYSEYKIVFVPKGYKNEKELANKLRFAYIKTYFDLHYLLSQIKKIKNKEDLIRYGNGFKVLIGLIFSKK